MQALGLQTYIWNNNIRSVLLLSGFPVLLVGLVFVFTLGMIWGGLLPSTGTADGDFALALSYLAAAAPAAIVVALIWFSIAWIFNQAIIDAATGAREVTLAEEPVFYEVLENLAISRGLKTPTPRIIETDALNAFASGISEGKFSITATRGLLRALDRDELEAVLAHELTHVINRDVRTMVIAAIFAGIITLLCQIVARGLFWGGGRGRGRGAVLFWVIAFAASGVGYMLAIVIRMAISRSREYVADAGSVELTKNPDAMIRALNKVAGHAHSDAPGSIRAMFLADDDEGVMGLFATHPPISKRIEALRRYGGGSPDAAVSGPPVSAAPEPTLEPGTAPGPWDEESAQAPSVPLTDRHGPWG